MGLGIGATTAVFSGVNAVLLKPLAVCDPDRLVVLMMIDTADASANGDSEVASPARFQYWRTQSAVLGDVSAFRNSTMNFSGAGASGGGTVERWNSMQVSAKSFRCWGIPILHGRSFTPEEDLPNGPRVAVLGPDLWRRRFGSDPRIVGKTIFLSGEPYNVSGVAGNTYAMREVANRPVDVYVPFQIDPNTTDQGVNFVVAARLKPGVTLAQAKERLRDSTAAYRTRFPGVLQPKEVFDVWTLREALVSDVRPLLLVLMCSVGLVLMIACSNVANLLLVRAAAQSREIAIRIAIGAGRGRMIRQLLTESILLSLGGGALGLSLGQSGIRTLLAANSTDLPLLGENGSGLTADWRLLVCYRCVSRHRSCFWPVPGPSGLPYRCEYEPQRRGGKIGHEPVSEQDSGRAGGE